MLAKQCFNLLIKAGLFIVSLGGLLIHLKLHPPPGPSWHYLPYSAGAISVLVVTVLFFFRRGYQFAYVINGMLVIIGTIAMTHFSLAFPPKVISISGIVTGSMLPFILVLWTNFVLGKALFELRLMKTDEEKRRGGKLFRYPNMGWWFIHLFALSTVYFLGHTLW